MLYIAWMIILSCHDNKKTSLETSIFELHRVKNGISVFFLGADSRSSKSTQYSSWKAGVTPAYDTMDPYKAGAQGADPKLIDVYERAL